MTRVPSCTSLGGGGQGAQRGVGLEHRLVGRAESGQLVEVVHHEDGVEACRLGLLRLRDDGGEELGDAGAVGEVRDLEAEFDGRRLRTTLSGGGNPVSLRANGREYQPKLASAPLLTCSVCPVMWRAAGVVKNSASRAISAATDGGVVLSPS